jgi:hypothetical protein
MFTILLKSNLLLLVGGIVIGLSLSSLFNGCGHNIPSTQLIMKPALLEKAVQQKEVVFKKQLDSLQSTGKILATQLQTTKTQLEQAKKKNLVLQTQVYDLIDKQGAVPVTDTAEMVADCDSLKTKVTELITASNDKDSLYETETANLEQQVHNKDSTINTQVAMYDSLKTSFNLSTSELQLEAAQNKVLQKHIKRQGFKNTLRTIGLVIVTGMAMHYLTNH